jgi:hypothetical protein
VIKKSTKAPVPPPPSKTRLMASAPPPTLIPDNLSRSGDDIQDMNFKVSADFHRRYKTTATIWGMSMKDLLEASFKLWVEKHGSRPSDAPDLFRDR